MIRIYERTLKCESLIPDSRITLVSLVIPLDSRDLELWRAPRIKYTLTRSSMHRLYTIYALYMASDLSLRLFNNHSYVALQITYLIRWTVI